MCFLARLTAPHKHQNMADLKRVAIPLLAITCVIALATLAIVNGTSPSPSPPNEEGRTDSQVQPEAAESTPATRTESDAGQRHSDIHLKLRFTDESNQRVKGVHVSWLAPVPAEPSRFTSLGQSVSDGQGEAVLETSQAIVCRWKCSSGHTLLISPSPESHVSNTDNGLRFDSEGDWATQRVSGLVDLKEDVTIDVRVFRSTALSGKVHSLRLPADSSIVEVYSHTVIEHAGRAKVDQFSIESTAELKADGSFLCTGLSPGSKLVVVNWQHDSINLCHSVGAIEMIAGPNRIKMQERVRPTRILRANHDDLDGVDATLSFTQPDRRILPGRVLRGSSSIQVGKDYLCHFLDGETIQLRAKLPSNTPTSVNKSYWNLRRPIECVDDKYVVDLTSGATNQALETVIMCVVRGLPRAGAALWVCYDATDNVLIQNNQIQPAQILGGMAKLQVSAKHGHEIEMIAWSPTGQCARQRVRASRGLELSLDMLACPSLTVVGAKPATVVGVAPAEWNASQAVFVAVSDHYGSASFLGIPAGMEVAVVGTDKSIVVSNGPNHLDLRL
jgi:hypothetical protein